MKPVETHRIEIEIILHVDEQLGGAANHPVAGKGDGAPEVMTGNGLVVYRAPVPEKIHLFQVADAKLDHIVLLNPEEAVPFVKTCLQQLVQAVGSQGLTMP